MNDFDVCLEISSSMDCFDVVPDLVNDFPQESQF